MNYNTTNCEKIATVIEDAGGKFIGKVRLQNTMYLLSLAGCESSFAFDYSHYGPCSAEVDAAILLAIAKGIVREEEHTADWGGKYAVYKSYGSVKFDSVDPVKLKLIQKAAQSSSILLELVATVAYFAVKKPYIDPWAETKSRKPEKATEERIEAAKQLYSEIHNIAKFSPNNKLPSFLDDNAFTLQEVNTPQKRKVKMR